MPITPFLLLSYEDSQRAIIDKINSTISQLSWLLNSRKLDTINVNPTTIQIIPVDPDKGSVVDTYGLNPIYLKFYPNKCWNSSFEIFNPTTLKPDYWDTDGVVSPDAVFVGTYSLKLTAGQYVEQKEVGGIGLANTTWWSWCPDTRITFRVKGSGKARASVLMGGVEQPLWKWAKNDKGQDVEVTSSTYFEFDGVVDWPNSLYTFCTTPASGGKIVLRFENSGSSDIYIDAVIIEADWTGRWPSFYTDGPGIIPVKSGEGLSSLAIGNTSSASSASSVAIGNGALANGNSSNIAIGEGTEAATVAGDEANIAMGQSASTTGGAGNVAIGRLATTQGAADNIAIGDAATAGTTTGETNNIAIGFGPLASDGVDNIALGDYSYAQGDNNIAIGDGVLAKGADNVALGNGARAGGVAGQINNIAIGDGSRASGVDNIAIGNSSSAPGGNDNIVIGHGSGASSGHDNIALGNGPTAGLLTAEYDNIAIGRGRASGGHGNICIGTGRASGGNGSIAIGEEAYATGATSVAIGSGATTSTPNEIRLGTAAETVNIPGTLVKGSGSFVIPHPDPTKHDTYDLRHCFVEAPTRGENLYRFQIEAKTAGERVDIPLPDYWQYLNENPQVWVSSVRHFGRAWSEVNPELTILSVVCELSGLYNVLLVGTRKDEIAKKWWDEKGVEKQKKETWRTRGTL